MKLQDPKLLKQLCYIDGAWTAADNGTTLPVHNPATGAELGVIPNMGSGETRRAIQAASTAQPAWAARTAKERANLLRRWFDLIIANQDDLAVLMTAEQGKPLAEAKGEIVYAASFIEWFAEEAKRLYGDVIPGHQADKRILVLRQPVGVVAAITPWNFPAAMITRKAGPALAAGCSFVCKPATQTPYSALALAELADRAGIPKGVFNILTGKATEIGGEMTSNPLGAQTHVHRVDGDRQEADGAMRRHDEENLASNSAATRRSSCSTTPISTPPCKARIASKYRNTGQTCVCANRLLVQAGVYEEFAQKLKAAVGKLRVGDGLAAVTDQGPLIDAKALAKVEEHIADAVSKGASITAGGKRHALGGTFFEPTILSDVTTAMLVAREETFGPVAPLVQISDRGRGDPHGQRHGIRARRLSVHARSGAQLARRPKRSNMASSASTPGSSPPRSRRSAA